MTATNKVRFGLENVHYALITEEGFATPKPLKGAVTLTLTAEGDSSSFHADNCPYVVFSTNSGYTGELEIASLEDDDAIALLGEVKAANGIVYEDAAAQPAPFALLYEINGNVTEQRFAFYNCTLSRPDRAANTTTDTTDPDTITLGFSAIPKEMQVGEETKKVTKGSVEKSSSPEIFGAWFTAVQTPATAAA